MMFLTPGTGVLPAGSAFAVERTCAVISIVDRGDARESRRPPAAPARASGPSPDSAGVVELDRKGHTPAVDAEILDELQRDDVAVEIGIADGAERVEDGRIRERDSHSLCDCTARFAVRGSRFALRGFATAVRVESEPRVPIRNPSDPSPESANPE